MNRSVVLTPQAQLEFDDAGDWYDNEQAGLGRDFTLAVHETLAKIAVNPEQYAPIFDDVRRAPVRKFRFYVVLYIIEADHIAVVSVFHTSRDPRHWQRRV